MLQNVAIAVGNMIYDGLDDIQDFWRSCERKMAFVYTLFGAKMQNFRLFYFGKRSWILHSKVFVEVKLLKGFKWFLQGCKVNLLFEHNIIAAL